METTSQPTAWFILLRFQREQQQLLWQQWRRRRQRRRNTHSHKHVHRTHTHTLCSPKINWHANFGVRCLCVRFFLFSGFIFCFLVESLAHTHTHIRTHFARDIVRYPCPFVSDSITHVLHLALGANVSSEWFKCVRLWIYRRLLKTWAQQKHSTVSNLFKFNSFRIMRLFELI